MIHGGRAGKNIHVFCFFRPKGKTPDNHTNNRKNAIYIYSIVKTPEEIIQQKHRVILLSTRIISSGKDKRFIAETIFTKPQVQAPRCIVNRKRKRV